MNLKDYTIECDWNTLLPVINEIGERQRVKKINPNLSIAPYPLSRSYLNEYFNNAKFNFSEYSSFIYDCAGSMYSFFLMTYGYTPGTTPGGSGALPAKPGGAGISFGLNPLFGVFDLDSPIIWILLALAGAVVIKKVID